MSLAEGPSSGPNASWWPPAAGADPAAAGLDTVGVDLSARTAPIDERCRVADGVWAVGDLTGKGAFTHVAMYQAGIVIADILGEDGPPSDYRALPRVTFSDPEVGSVGLTEKQAREQFPSVSVGARPSRTPPVGGSIRQALLLGNKPSYFSNLAHVTERS